MDALLRFKESSFPFPPLLDWDNLYDGAYIISWMSKDSRIVRFFILRQRPTEENLLNIIKLKHWGFVRNIFLNLSVRFLLAFYVESFSSRREIYIVASRDLWIQWENYVCGFRGNVGVTKRFCVQPKKYSHLLGIPFADARRNN